MNGISFGKILGIKLELHSTFVWLILLMILFLGIFQPETFIPSMVLLFFLFLSVFLHELAHSLVAIKLGIKVKKIVLLPIGGVSLTEEIPQNPKKEFLMAIAGPLFNFAVVFAILFAVSFFPQLPFPYDLIQQNTNGTATVEQVEAAVMNFPIFALLWVNLLLGVFNLLVPALPMDGGRVARSLLAIKVGFPKATHIIAKLSVFIAIVLGLIGFFSGDLILIIIAIFVFMGAKQENEIVSIKELFGSQTIQSIINKKPVVLNGDISLAEAFDLMNKTNQTTYLVDLKNGFGIINLNKFFEIKKIEWNALLLKDVCKRIHSINSSALASNVFTKFLTKDYSILPVMDNETLIGIIEFNSLQNFMELKKLSQK